MVAFGLSTLPSDPLDLFKAWLALAQEHPHIQYAHATCLSTRSPEGFPEGRIVLLHGFGPDGFVFFTDSRSAKGRALAKTPRAALTFYWGPLERQVRLQGNVEPATDAVADLIFQERPRRSKGTAWASSQSAALAAREHLDAQMARLDAEYGAARPIPRPPYWKAYRIRPLKIEFWQARARRLHDRVLYTKTGKQGWACSLLYP